ncbi:MAG TPA: CBS domain-containing protein, partial [Firmicutes bacterium]|nr:CBS domain-containing protein [Bacillota bacterium]
PVLSDSGRKVAGIVYMKDAIREVVSNPKKGSLPVTAVMRSPYLVPAGENILRVFSRLKRDRVHLAVVVQGNSPVGIITMDDLLEELVGEIPEEAYAGSATLVPGKAYSSSRITVSSD